MSTKLPPEPTSLLEQIICDAIWITLVGRFYSGFKLLYKELHEHGMVGTCTIGI
jgi:hypothetical protein